MLVLSRRKNEEIYIVVNGKMIKIMLVDIRGDRVRLGFEADQDVGVYRKEVYETIQSEHGKNNLNPPD